MLVHTQYRCHRNALDACDAQWQLLACHECAMSALWQHRQSPTSRTSWEHGGTPSALLRNATIILGMLWHLHVMKNMKLFALFSSILVQSQSAMRNFKSSCQHRGIVIECDRGFTCHPFKLQSPNLGQKCILVWLRSLLFWGLIDLDLQGQIWHQKSKFIPFCACLHDDLSPVQVSHQIWTRNAS